MRPELPSGTVTFLFTDVEGSTRLLYELGAEAYAAELAEHRTLVREACAAQGGVEVDTQGDASFFAFPTAPGALAAAAALTEALAATDIRVRVGIHTGTPHLTSEGYVGDDVHLAARVASSGHGGQILVSEETSGLARDGELVSLGTHRLKDIPEPVRLYQLGEGSFPPLKTEANTNLPTPASSFLGREAELAQADLLLQETRLLTVTGPGGAGKTRFALELATRAREERFSDYRDGVFSCFFSSLRDPSLLLATIAQTLSVREQPGTSALETLASHLQAKRLLLLLDNLEHLLEAAPELSELLQSCPTLTLLCTSRERLRLQGEFAYELPPLVEEEGVSLFCERARTEPTDATRALCDHLEGLPLALELAAARMGLLSAEQLLERLSGRLDLLKGTRDADPRQQTLRATIQWSYDLLSPEEQTLFARLSVFSGGCTLEAAEEVCDADLDSLHSLVDKSLLRRVDTETGPRFWMLETIREFAGERLEDMGDAEEAMRRHADFVLRLATQFEAGRGSEREIRTFSAEQDNFRTAIAWAEERDRSDTQLDLISRCWRYWWYRGHPMEGLRWVESALACSEGERSARRAKVLAAGAMFAYRFGDLSSMRDYAEESLEIARTLGDKQHTTWPLIFLGISASEAGNLDEAVTRYEEAIAVARDVDDRALIGVATNNLGVVAGLRGDRTRAVALFEEAQGISRDLGTPDELALETLNLADSLYQIGRHEEAMETAMQGLALAREVANFTALFAGFALLGALFLKRGRADMGSRLLGTAEMLRERYFQDVTNPDAELVESTKMALARALGVDEYAKAFAEGKSMTLDDAVQYPLSQPVLPTV